MALTQSPSAPPVGRRRRVDRPWVDTGAPVVVWLYVVLQFEPLSTLISPPGSASGVVFPAVGLGVLILTPPERLGRVPVSLPLVSLVAWLGLSLLWSEVPFFTQYLIRSQVLPLVILVLVVGTMPPKQVIRTLMAIFVTIALVALVSAIVLPSGRQTVIDGVDQVGFRGWFIHKNVMGAFIVAGLCLVLPFSRGRWRRLVIAVFIGLILGTRSATVAGGFMGVLFLWGCMAATASQRTRRERQFVLTLSIGSAIVGVLLVLGLLPTILDLYDKDITFSGRTDIWAESLVTIRERPLQGYGLGGVWTDPLSPVTVELRDRITFDAAHAHNSAIELLLQVGIVGLALTTVFVVQLVRLGVACVRQPVTAEYGRWALLTVLAVFIMGLAEPLFQGPYLGLLVIVWVTLTRARNDAVRAGTWRAPWARG